MNIKQTRIFAIIIELTMTAFLVGSGIYMSLNLNSLISIYKIILGVVILLWLLSKYVKPNTSTILEVIYCLIILYILWFVIPFHFALFMYSLITGFGFALFKLKMFKF